MGKQNRQQRRQHLQDSAIPKAQASNDIGFGGGGSGYDGANSSTNRSTLIGFPTNSFREIDRWTRVELTKKSRSLQANLPIMGRVISKIAQNAVGKGIIVNPITKDAEWNALNKVLFDEWAVNPSTYDIAGRIDFYRHQLLAVEAMIGDGEHFAAPVTSESGAPMVQLFDCFEVDSPYGYGDESAKYVDGVRVNEYGRAISYAVRELARPGDYSAPKFRDVPRDSMIHLFEQRRVKQYRGLTWFFSAINQGIDVGDLLSLITSTAKLHEAMAVQVKKGAKIGRGGVAGKVQAHAGGTPADDDFKALEKVWGGGMISYVGADGDVKLLASDRPSQNILEYVKFLMQELATAAKLPWEVVMSMASLGGATARGALEDAQSTFDMMQDKIIYTMVRRIYIWRTAKAMKEGRLPRCKDPNWWFASYRGPKKLTVDMGRTADANIKLIQAGALSLGRYYEESGLDAKEELRDQLNLEQWYNKEREARGLPPRQLGGNPPGSVTQLQLPEDQK